MRLLVACVTGVCLLGIAAPSQAVDLCLVSEPYYASGLFTNPLIPVEQEEVTITVRAIVDGEVPAGLEANVEIADSTGKKLIRKKIVLALEEGDAVTGIEIAKSDNGQFFERVVVVCASRSLSAKLAEWKARFRWPRGDR